MHAVPGRLSNGHKNADVEAARVFCFRGNITPFWGIKKKNKVTQRVEYFVQKGKKKQKKQTLKKKRDWCEKRVFWLSEQLPEENTGPHQQHFNNPLSHASKLIWNEDDDEIATLLFNRFNIKSD